MRCGCLLVLRPFALCSWSAVEYLILNTFLWCFGVVVVVAVGRVGVFSGVFSSVLVAVATATGFVAGVCPAAAGSSGAVRVLVRCTLLVHRV